MILGVGWLALGEASNLNRPSSTPRFACLSSSRASYMLNEDEIGTEGIHMQSGTKTFCHSPCLLGSLLLHGGERILHFLCHGWHTCHRDGKACFHQSIFSSYLMTLSLPTSSQAEQQFSLVCLPQMFSLPLSDTDRELGPTLQPVPLAADSLCRCLGSCISVSAWRDHRGHRGPGFLMSECCDLSSLPVLTTTKRRTRMTVPKEFLYKINRKKKNSLCCIVIIKYIIDL